MYTIEKSCNAHLQLIYLVSKEEDITTTSNSEDSTIEHNNQRNIVESKFEFRRIIKDVHYRKVVGFSPSTN